ncbi:Ms4533A family Cys-rich leader peptide [Streptomyces sp. NPDC088725]|uniref:Ms4533A family Cys-rich leader peptide n=1 Tax=Streptomyces sp. NPDC088725 TaxID=3365873 RepID=UPI003800FF15
MPSQPLGVSRGMRQLSQLALTRATGSSIFLGMSSPCATSGHTAFELALIGVTPLCVADILCS